MKKNKIKSDESGVNFRYEFFSEDITELISQKLMERNIIHTVNKSRHGSFVINIADIDKIDFDAEYIFKINEDYKINTESFDFFVYLTSYKEMGGMSISGKTMEYIRIIGGRSIEFSYVIV